MCSFMFDILYRLNTDDDPYPTDWRLACIAQHISHPSIVSYLHSFTTQTHHCLILEHVTGGELFDLLNNNDKHSRLTEPLLRRMWSELCRAVAWMHSVALVHRDIKLESAFFLRQTVFSSFLRSLTLVISGVTPR